MDIPIVVHVLLTGIIALHTDSNGVMHATFPNLVNDREHPHVAALVVEHDLLVNPPNPSYPLEPNPNHPTSNLWIRKLEGVRVTFDMAAGPPFKDGRLYTTHMIDASAGLPDRAKLKDKYTKNEKKDVAARVSFEGGVLKDGWIDPNYRWAYFVGGKQLSSYKPLNEMLCLSFKGERQVLTITLVDIKSGDVVEKLTVKPAQDGTVEIRMSNTMDKDIVIPRPQNPQTMDPHFRLYRDISKNSTGGAEHQSAALENPWVPQDTHCHRLNYPYPCPDTMSVSEKMSLPGGANCAPAEWP